MTFTLYHAAPSRSSSVRVLMHALDVPYELKLLILSKGEQRQPEYRAINPLGKVPCLVHDGVVITETVAIFLYLADLFAQKGLAPAITDKKRGEYLRWMTFYAACFEPAIVDRAHEHTPEKQGICTYATFDIMLHAIIDWLSTRDYFLGDTLSAADLLWASGLAWTTKWNLIPENSVLAAYMERVMAHPSFAAIDADDARLNAAAA
jgi:glutathione S-transferase